MSTLLWELSHFSKGCVGTMNCVNELLLINCKCEGCMGKCMPENKTHNILIHVKKVRLELYRNMKDKR